MKATLLTAIIFSATALSAAFIYRTSGMQPPPNGSPMQGPSSGPLVDVYVVDNSAVGHNPPKDYWFVPAGYPCSATLVAKSVPYSTARATYLTPGTFESGNPH